MAGLGATQVSLFILNQTKGIQTPACRHAAPRPRLPAPTGRGPPEPAHFYQFSNSKIRHAGTLPPALGSLLGLHTLHLGENRLGGSLGGFAGALQPGNSLWVLNVTGNKLTGPVPDQLALAQLFNRCVCVCVGGGACVGVCV